MGYLAVSCSAVSAVVNFFDNIGGKIKNAIGNAGQLLYSVGQAIVQGLVSGIVGAWHWVTDKLSSLISGLSSAAKKLLGITSPSKVFMEIGHFTGQGLAAGLDASRGTVADAAARMLGAASGGASFGVAPAFAGAAGAGGSQLGAIRKDADSASAVGITNCNVLEYDSTLGLALIALNLPY